MPSRKAVQGRQRFRKAPQLVTRRQLGTKPVGSNQDSEHKHSFPFLTAVPLGVHRNAGLLRAAIGTYSNDFRLGANEAPSAIISVFLGDQLTRICDKLANGEELPTDAGNSMLQLGVDGLPDLKQDTTDRNRTSPFAFTGNKFEFRAAGSSASLYLSHSLA